jgi:two-component system, chemotaxis family, response regulator Rcp1
MDKYNSKQAIILLVEDNEGDARLAIEAFKGGKIENELHHVRDGVEAMEFIKQEGQFKDAPRPDLILLDLNMPRKNGRAVLEEISHYPHLSTIPVIVLTTSESETDIKNCYSLNANCYISKPVDLDQFLDVIKSIEEFWFSIVKLPSFINI